MLISFYQFLSPLTFVSTQKKAISSTVAAITGTSITLTTAWADPITSGAIPPTVPSLSGANTVCPHGSYAALARLTHPRHALFVHSGGFARWPPCLKPMWFDRTHLEYTVCPDESTAQ